MATPLFELATNIFLSNLNRLSAPYKLTFAITYRCNARCSTCNIWQRKSENELTLPEIEKIFEKNKFSWVNLTGGEPFLREDLPDIVRAIAEMNPGLYFLNFTSNGTLPDKMLPVAEKIRSFVRIPKFAIGVSVEGPPEIDSKIRRMPNSFNLSLRTLKGLREIFKGTGYQPFVSYTISPHNLGSIKQTIAAIRGEIPDFRLTEFHVNLFHFSSHYYGNVGYQLDPEFEAKAIKEIRDYLEIYSVPFNADTWLEKKYLKLLVRFIERKRTPLPCQALRASCYLDDRGNVYPCAMYDKILGNMRDCDYSLDPVWRSGTAQETRKIIDDYRCPNCWTPCEAYQTILGSMIKRR